MYAVLQVAPALDAGGVERTTIEMAEAITRDGGRALVASAGGRLEGELAAAGGELLRMPVDTKNPVTAWANAGRLEAAARVGQVDLIHARSRASAWSALMAARRVKRPFVTTYHGIYNARSPLKRFYNSVMARGDIVIANSEFTRAHVLKEHDVAPDRVIAIPRAVDVARFDPATVTQDRIDAVRANWEAEGRFVALVPARLTRWKGQLVAIEAAARAGGVKLVLAGDAQGREKFVEELRAAAASAHLGQDVIVAGHILDMPAAFMAADAVLLPSIEPEAFGRAAVEAQAMGRIVIASANGGYTETIKNGETGYLVPPGDAEALAAKLKDAMAMDASARCAIGAAAAKHARVHYSKEALQSATLRVYHRLMEARA
jgi:glycosyltransferase involved in cell wall biosynthesis